MVGKRGLGLNNLDCEPKKTGTEDFQKSISAKGDLLREDFVRFWN